METSGRDERRERRRRRRRGGDEWMRGLCLARPLCSVRDVVERWGFRDLLVLRLKPSTDSWGLARLHNKGLVSNIIRTRR